MAVRTLIIIVLTTLVGACRYDLDVSGLVYTPVPVNERFELSEQWIAEQGGRVTTVAGDAYTVLVGSDSHVGPAGNLQRFMEDAVEEEVALMAIAGDLCTGWEEDYAVADAVLAEAGDMEICVVPGNHDLYFGGWHSFYGYFGPSAYTLTVHTPDTSDLYIFLDTGGGTVGSKQLDWLKTLLEQARGEHRHAVVVTHVNFFRNRFTSSTNILNEEVLVLLDLFARHRINVVIQGHDHKRYEEVSGETTYITLDAMKDENPDASYLELTASAAGVDYRFVPFN